MSSTGNASLYVGDIAPEVTEQHLQQVFSTAGTIQSVKLCRDPVTGLSLGYGFINYHSPEVARSALEMLNHVTICGRPVRIMPSHRDANFRRSGVGNIFVKNLDALVNNRALHDRFRQFGTILSAKVALDASGASKGFGFVQFEDPEAATQARIAVHGTEFCGEILSVADFKPAKDRAAEPGKFCNVYVKGIGSATSEEDLKTAFGKFGPLISTIVMRNDQGQSRGFGFLNFLNSDDAERAVKEMDGHVQDGCIWKLSPAKRKEESSKAVEQQPSSRVELIVKNLQADCTESELRQQFQIYGDIHSVRTLKDVDGRCKGTGFVAFKNSQDAEAAVTGFSKETQISVSLLPKAVRRQPKKSADPEQPISHSMMVRNALPYMQAPAPPSNPGIAYYAGPQIYYGPPLPGPPSQQQMPTAFLPIQRPSTPQQSMLDQRYSYISVPSAGPYIGQGQGQMRAMSPANPMASSMSIPVPGYEGHLSAPVYHSLPGRSLMRDMAQLSLQTGPSGYDLQQRSNLTHPSYARPTYTEEGRYAHILASQEQLPFQNPDIPQTYSGQTSGFTPQGTSQQTWAPSHSQPSRTL